MTDEDAGLLGPWTKTGFLPCGAGQLRYASCGSGQPVVLLPKLGGWIADWRHVAAILATRFRVLAIDPPGHGGTLMAGPPAYLQTVPESAAAIAAGLDSLGLNTVSLIGNSLGGCIGIAMAALFPGLIERLALVSVSLAPRMSLAALADSDATQPPGAFDAQGYPLPRSADDLRRFGPISDAVIAEQTLSRAACGLWLRPSERGVGRMGVEDYLPRLRLPVLVVNGSAGHYLKYEPVARRLIAGVRIVTVPETGPFVHQEVPDLTAAHLANFLDT